VPVAAERLSAGGQQLEALDLLLAEPACGMVLGEVLDQVAQPVADLQREVRGRGTHELAHVVDRDLVLRVEAVRALHLAHGVALPSVTGTISRRESIRAWTSSEIAVWSPINQA
jgi:hypothetical protein